MSKTVTRGRWSINTKIPQQRRNKDATRKQTCDFRDLSNNTKCVIIRATFSEGYMLEITRNTQSSLGMIYDIKYVHAARRVWTIESKQCRWSSI